MREQSDEILESLRSRIIRGLASGALLPGDRLPSARSLQHELATDYRVILSAYRHLVGEGLVDIRPRGGTYVAANGSTLGAQPVPQAWFANLFAEGIARGITVPELPEWLRRCTETLRLRAVVVAPTQDQSAGVCRELRDDFGIESSSVTAADAMIRPMVSAVRRADLLIGTEATESLMSTLGAVTNKAVIIIKVRPDLAGDEWRHLLRRPVYAVVGNADFADVLREFVAGTPGAVNLRVLVLGVDDLDAIPADAPTYLTQEALTRLGERESPGRRLPPARTISMESARQILRFVVGANRKAVAMATEPRVGEKGASVRPHREARSV